MLEYMHEDANFALYPTAQTAYEIAMKHFDANNPGEYDMQRALHYFEETASIDPAFRHVHHQLARIYFIRGSFEQALAQINTELRGTDSPDPASYYIKGLILGFMGSYENAAIFYRKYLEHNPNNWAGLNDYAWVLLRADHPHEALDAVTRGLVTSPHNPWLLNSKATALYELKLYNDALTAAKDAIEAADNTTPTMWYAAYPGNDPAIAHEGIQKMRRATRDNYEKIAATINAQ
jgi:tetratricopeptide (TPR) repeat protein